MGRCLVAPFRSAPLGVLRPKPRWGRAWFPIWFFFPPAGTYYRSIGQRRRCYAPVRDTIFNMQPLKPHFLNLISFQTGFAHCMLFHDSFQCTGSVRRFMGPLSWSDLSVTTRALSTSFCGCKQATWCAHELLCALNFNLLVHSSNLQRPCPAQTNALRRWHATVAPLS
jgi:hypothetical protein